uniref:RING-type domain-containing protein n=1 Tax=Chromera velia CCMP2878 TaxID=1169474 RepID=A0A0G4HUD7_9ALVE|mmetsp:Transcript_46330/g.91361  ORF Transcript_46330/g.91361 Transcript_46330/m.91361 type:complete len:598 (-) Transcript_46330:93-1886(-)|eukprot:Cvel_31831.t1-p1 / transcript=Cvel_31831.t1 / gene=Cvel_31831 / organism=Chromera_velia_CCMP2878 / gene_product=hypothetical protein / transcript_product=hypothetical protein / location=Cvel_scaffold4812:3974-6889(-) / protein_length=597 / sequence_SO=supercontig / SO=protein_coding / is_pseudo=false
MENYQERVAQLEESLCCPKCFQFFLEPSILDCGHVICNRCIAVDSFGSRSCVLCRRISETVKPNYPLRKALEMLLGSEGQLLWILRNGVRSAAPRSGEAPGRDHGPQYAEPPPPDYHIIENTRPPPGPPPSRPPDDVPQRHHPVTGPSTAPHSTRREVGTTAYPRAPPGEMPASSPPRRAAMRPDPYADSQVPPPARPRTGPPQMPPPSYPAQREVEKEGSSTPFYESHQQPPTEFPPAYRSGPASSPPTHLPPTAVKDERLRYPAAKSGGGGGGDGPDDDEIELFGRRARRAVHVAAIPREQGPEGCNLFVCRLPEWADELDLYYAVRHMPGLVGLTIVRHDNGVSKNLAYVSYMRHRDAYNAILALHGLVMAPTIAYPPRVRETGRMRAIKVDVKRVEHQALQRHLTAEQAASINLGTPGDLLPVERGSSQLDAHQTPSTTGNGTAAGEEENGGGGGGTAHMSRPQGSPETPPPPHQQMTGGGTREIAESAPPTERESVPAGASSQSSHAPFISAVGGEDDGRVIESGDCLGVNLFGEDETTEGVWEREVGLCSSSGTFAPHLSNQLQALNGDGVNDFPLEVVTGWPRTSTSPDE